MGNARWQMRAPRGTHRDAAGESEVAPRGIPAPPCGRRCAANPPRRKAVGTPQGTPKRRTPFSAFFSSKWRNVRAGVRCSDRMYEQTQGDLERLGQRLLEPERLVPRDMTGFAWHRSWAISRPALADSGPELAWDQHRSVRSAGARPRRPLWRARDKSQCSARSRRRATSLARRNASRRLGLLLCQPR